MPRTKGTEMSRLMQFAGAAALLAASLAGPAIAGDVAPLPTPGPIAGAALPVVIVALGYAAWRKRRSRLD